MSNKALNWAWASELPDGPRFVLVALADNSGETGDPAGWTCFPSVGTLAEMTGKGERTIERHLKFLIDTGWITRRRRPGRKLLGGARAEDGAFVYTLLRARRPDGPAGDGPDNLAGRSGADAPANLAGGNRVDRPANGDTSTRQTERIDPPNPANPPHPPIEIIPQGTLSDPARAGEPGGSGAAAGEAEREEKDRAGEEAAWARLSAGWARVSPGRLAPKPGRRAFRDACRTWPPERVADAGLRYLAADPDVKKHGAMRLHVWLDEGRFEPWLTPGDGEAGAAGPGPVGWNGPPGTRAQVVSLRGEAFARSYLDPARWDEGRGVVVARSSMAAARLGELVEAGIPVFGPIEVGR